MDIAIRRAFSQMLYRRSTHHQQAGPATLGINPFEIVGCLTDQATVGRQAGNHPTKLCIMDQQATDGGWIRDQSFGQHHQIII